MVRKKAQAFLWEYKYFFLVSFLIVIIISGIFECKAQSPKNYEVKLYDSQGKLLNTWSTDSFGYDYVGIDFYEQKTKKYIWICGNIVVSEK